jgi:hypothetical protein
MLTEIHVRIDADPDDLIIKFYDYTGERKFWVRNLGLLEQVARICLEAQVDGLETELAKRIAAANTKKAA